MNPFEGSVAFRLKIWPEFFEATIELKKLAEFREKDGHVYEVGQMGLLDEWNPITEAYTGRSVLVEVTDVLDEGQMGMPDGKVMFYRKPLTMFVDGGVEVDALPPAAGGADHAGEPNAKPFALVLGLDLGKEPA